MITSNDYSVVAEIDQHLYSTFKTNHSQQSEPLITLLEKQIKDQLERKVADLLYERVP
jgi:hypothetical protein